MDIYQLSALMAEQRRAERLVQAERRRHVRAAQVASRHQSGSDPAPSHRHATSPQTGPAAAVVSHRQAARSRVRVLVRLGHVLRARSLPLSKVPSDLR
jgi:hypothetical protein